MTKQQHKVRGCGLSGMLILIALHGVLSVVLVRDAVRGEYAPQMPLILASLVIIAIADIIAAIGMWYWKKWGLYLFAIATLIGIGAHIVLTANIWIAIYDIIPLGILGYLINTHNKMRYFE